MPKLCNPKAHFHELNHFRPQPFYYRGNNRIEGVLGLDVGIKGQEFYIKGLIFFAFFYVGKGCTIENLVNEV